MTTVICGRGNLKETRRCTYMYNMTSYCSVCKIEVTDDSEALGCDECYVNMNSSGDEIANVNFYAVRLEATRIR